MKEVLRAMMFLFSGYFNEFDGNFFFRDEKRVGGDRV